MSSYDQRLADFEAQRPRLRRLAYRMLGSLSEAEDIMQDAWLRWSRAVGGIDTPAAYLTRIVTRLCLDQMKSARSRREEYVGAWIPEPLMGTTEPEDDIADEVTLTLMMALERLSPLERAAFLLHDVFGVCADGHRLDAPTRYRRGAAAGGTRAPTCAGRPPTLPGRPNRGRSYRVRLFRRVARRGRGGAIGDAGTRRRDPCRRRRKGLRLPQYHQRH
jgi:RNA polymerase sigma factor (sigma-70 family)